MEHFLRDLVCGSLSGIANCISGYAFDTMKVRMQMDHSLTLRSSFKAVFAEKGFIQLFSGMYYPLITVPLINAILFSAYELYKKVRGKSELSFIDGIQNGAFAGLANTVIVGPVELVKCRMQIDSVGRFASSSQCAKEIIRTQGVKGLFRGTFATAFREVFAYAGQFATYEFLKQRLAGTEKRRLSFIEGMAVGTFAGINCWLLSYPQDIVKTVLQVSPGKYRAWKFLPDGGFIECAKDLYKADGLRGFWIGITPCLIRAAVANAFGIAVYEETQYIYTHDLVQNY